MMAPAWATLRAAAEDVWISVCVAALGRFAGMVSDPWPYQPYLPLNFLVRARAVGASNGEQGQDRTADNLHTPSY